MRRFILCGGVHGKVDSLEFLRQIVALRRPDGILFAGGVLKPTREYASKKTCWDLTRADRQFLEKFFETIGMLDIFTAIIPGATDTPLDEFLKLGMTAEVEYPGVHLVHATLVEKGAAAICGLGCGLCEEGLPECEYYSRSRAEYVLRILRDSDQPQKILLLAVAPPGPLGGADGNPLAGDLIDSYHPSLCVVAGPNKCCGMQRFASTLVINPGHLAQGRAAWLDWKRPVDEQVEFLTMGDLKPLEVRI